MRYAALNQGADMLALLRHLQTARRLPDPATQSRYSDDSSTRCRSTSIPEAAAESNNFDAQRTGQKIFADEGCDACHPAPLYTNNKLTPADGFTVPRRIFVYNI